jgi:hypothetical protein
MSVTRLGDENDTETANGGNGGDGPPVGGAGNG